MGVYDSAARTLPSGWTARPAGAFACPPKSTWVKPVEANEVSGVPSAFSRPTVSCQASEFVANVCADRTITFPLASVVRPVTVSLLSWLTSRPSMPGMVVWLAVSAAA